MINTHLAGDAELGGQAVAAVALKGNNNKDNEERERE